MSSNMQQKSVTRGILILSLGLSLLWSGCDQAALDPGFDIFQKFSSLLFFVAVFYGMHEQFLLYDQ